MDREQEREQEREFLRSVDIVALVQEYVTLRRHGREWQGLCPFHNERTPSFSVNQEKGSWYCHGCHEGGNAAWFLAKIEGVSRGQAVRLLAERYGVSLAGGSFERDAASEEKRERLRSACAEAARFYHEQLFTSDAAAAREYMEGRGITRAVAGEFGLGYAPGAPDALSQRLKKSGWTLEELVEAGLCLEGESGPVDRMRHRLILPIADPQGRPIAFGGRALGDANPKYLNTSDSLLFHKGRTLYLLHRARRAIQNSGAAVVVEGYLDALMCHHHGIDNVVATLGTAITAQHVQALRRLAKQLILALDADDAGVRAAERAAAIAGEEEVAVSIASIPARMDPDSFLRLYGADRFREVIGSAVGVVEYRLAHILKSADLQSEEGRRKAVQECTRVLGGVASPLQRDRYVDDLARLFSGDQVSGERLLDNIEVVREEIIRQVRINLGGRNRTFSHRLAEAASGKPQIEDEQSRAEGELMAALLKDPTLAPRCEGVLFETDFRTPEHRTIYRLLQQFGPPDEWLALIEDETTAQTAARLMARAERVVDPEATAEDCLRKVKDYEKRLRLEELRRKLIEVTGANLDTIGQEEMEEYYVLSGYFKPE